MDRRDKVFVVTGGASGIGAAAVRLLAARGDRVAVWDRDGAGAADAAADALRRGAPAAVGIACDIGREDQVARALAVSEGELGPLAGLFANAGVGTGGGLLHELPAEVWDRVIGG